MKLLSVAVSGLALLVAAPAIAGPFDGGTVHTQYRFPTQDSVYQDYGEVAVSGNTLIAAGLGGVDGINLYANSSGLLADFSQAAYSSVWTSTVFNGFVVYDDTNTVAPITSVTIGSGTNMVGLDASRISFDADHIFLNWQGLSFDNSTRVALNVNNSAGAVPEPATWAMMILGLGMIGAGLRYRRKSTKVSFA